MRRGCALFDEINAGLGDTTTSLTTERDTTRGQLGTQRQQLNRLIDALALGTIDPAAIAERVNDLKRSTDRLQAQVAGLEARIAEAKPSSSPRPSSTRCPATPVARALLHRARRAHRARATARPQV